MGRIKGHHIKVLAKALVKRKPEEFSEVFAETRETLRGRHLLDYSKKEFNKLAAQVTNLTKRLRHPPEFTSRPRQPREGREGSERERGYGRRPEYRRGE